MTFSMTIPVDREAGISVAAVDLTSIGVMFKFTHQTLSSRQSTFRSTLRIWKWLVGVSVSVDRAASHWTRGMDSPGGSTG